jgi:hypothetical protein
MLIGDRIDDGPILTADKLSYRNIARANSNENTTMDVTIRIYFRKPDGRIEDGSQDFALEDFAGVLPAIGDTILDPGVVQGLDRHQPENRDVWKVVDRVFNPRGLSKYVALVVEERRGTVADGWI